MATFKNLKEYGSTWYHPFNYWITSTHKQTLAKIVVFWFLDDKGLLRERGRLGEASLPETAKFTIILPKGDGFTTSLIRMTHVDNESGGDDWLHFHLRQFYCIISSRQQIRSMIHTCFLCQKYNAVRGNQQMAPLPRDRLSVKKPFSIVGVDYTGELKIKMT